MVKMYGKLRMFYVKICNIFRSFKFFYHLWKEGVFQEQNSEVTLKVIQEFVTIEHCVYPKVLKNNRSVEASIKLINVLINEYIENKAEKVLDQILEVLKNEFIRRNLPSDKQF